MNDKVHHINRQQMLERLSRERSSGSGEIAVVTSPGARTNSWAIKIKNLSSYNVYNVIAIILGGPGSEPTEIGQEIPAINLAESFTEQGTLQGGTYAIMTRIGGKNIFFTKP